MNVLYIVLLFLIFIILTKKDKKESFNDVFRDYNYLKCCNKYGCNHYNCQNYIFNNQTPIYLIGLLQKLKLNDFESLLELYKQYDVKSKEYIYLYKYKSDDFNAFFIRLETDNVYDNSIVNINDEDYKIILYSTDIMISNNYHIHNELTTFPQYVLFNPKYSNRIIKPDTEIVGFIFNDKEKLQLYEEHVLPRRNIYRYYVIKKNNMIELRQNKENVEHKLLDGDYVDVLDDQYKVVLTKSSTAIYKN